MVEGTALERRQNIVPGLCGGNWNRVWDGFELEMRPTRRGVGRQKIKRGAAEARTRLEMYVFYNEVALSKIFSMNLDQLLVSEVHNILRYVLL